MFDMQSLIFFTEGNIFTGCSSRADRPGEIIRYRVKPDKENERLLAWSWHEDKCFESVADRAREASFPLSDKGIEEIQDWLLEIWPDPHVEVLAAQTIPQQEED